jgi:predicted ATPase/two-component SAPR family response regulator
MPAKEGKLSVKLFGRFEVERNGIPIDSKEWGRRKTQALFKFLLLQRGRVVTIDQILDALYPDSNPQKAAGNLRTHISRLRRILEPDLKRGQDSRFILNVRGGYIFREDAPCWIDAEEFQHLALEGQKLETEQQWEEALRRYKQAVELYRGDLLIEDRYESWAEVLSRRWQERYLEVLSHLAECYAHLGRYEQAVECCQKILEIEPYRESAYRQLMLYLCWLGEQGKAIHAYKQCVQALQEHLAVRPSLKTRELWKQIRRGKIAPPPQEIPHNLPTPIGRFIGRQRELKEMRDLLAEARILTITGVAGCGKTRLALQVAADLRKAYPGGVWWVELAPLSEPDQIPRAIADALRLEIFPLGSSSILEALRKRLRAQRALLVLNDCEHLLVDCAQIIEDLLHSCPDLTVLATSRERLRVEGEISRSIPPLPLPPSEDPSSAAHLRQYDAIRFFEDRARTTQAGFTLTGENAPYVVQICRRLDGLPLALELAAAALQTLSLEELTWRLDDCFHLLIHGRRTAHTRHRSLRALFDWSYNLLSQSEKELFRRLSVFVGEFSLGEVEQVCLNENQAGHGLDLLWSLVEKSLVCVETPVRGGQTMRYRLLETVRAYGAKKLEEAGEAEEYRQRYRDFCRRLTKQAGSERTKLLHKSQSRLLHKQS